MTEDEAKEFHRGLNRLHLERGFADLIEGVGPLGPTEGGAREHGRCLVYRLRRALQDLKHADNGIMAGLLAKVVVFAPDISELGASDPGGRDDAVRLGSDTREGRISAVNAAAKLLRKIEDDELS